MMRSKTRSRLSAAAVLTAALTLASFPIRASDPVGIYCIVDRVVMQPNETEPTSVQIFGAFSVAVPRSANGTQTKPAGAYGTTQDGNVYAAVQTGYMYFTCAKGKDSACQAEWTDLKSVAGKGEIVGFGFRYSAPGVVHKLNETPANPDVYPLNLGVVKMGQYSSIPDMAAALTAAARAK